MSFAAEWIRRARARARRREGAPVVTMRRVIAVHSRHGMTLGIAAALAARGEPAGPEVTIPGTLVCHWPPEGD